MDTVSLAWVSVIRSQTCRSPAHQCPRQPVPKAFCRYEGVAGHNVEHFHKVIRAESRGHDLEYMMLGAYVKHTTLYAGALEATPYFDIAGPHDVSPHDVSDVNPIQPSVEAKYSSGPAEPGPPPRDAGNLPDRGRRRRTTYSSERG